jgi:elongation factor Ts
MVKEIRERTGARMNDCVDALKASDYDMDKAMEWLRVKNISRGEAKEKKAGDGLLAMAIQTVFGNANGTDQGQSIVLVEMSASTDFATRNPEFRETLRLASMQALLQNCHSLEGLLGQPLLGCRVVDSVKALSGKLGESISIRRFVRVDGPAGVYLHNDRKQAAIVELDGVSRNDAIELGKDLAMHVVFAKPRYLSKTDVPDDEVEREKDLVLRQLKDDPRNSRKPAEILDKIAAGQMNKFFGTYCLLDQPYYRENKKTVAAVLRAKRPEARIRAFHLMVVGE